LADNLPPTTTLILNLDKKVWSSPPSMKQIKRQTSLCGDITHTCYMI
jgi:hypothetical protein